MDTHNQQNYKHKYMSWASDKTKHWRPDNCFSCKKCPCIRHFPCPCTFEFYERNIRKVKLL